MGSGVSAANLALAQAAIEHGAAQKYDELADFLDFLPPVHNVLEIGSMTGGTLWLWAQIATGLVVSVDLQNGPALGELPTPVTRIEGDSHAPRTLDAVRDALAGWGSISPSVDLLFIDGDHSYEGVRRDAAWYMGLVRTGGVVAFHDIVRHDDPAASEVERFWTEFKATFPAVIHEFICAEARDTLGGVVPVNSCGIGAIRRVT
jgi:predicted O-methyltransferase YrrM